MLLALLLGCAPALTRFPGPLDRLGKGAVEPLGALWARRDNAPDPTSGSTTTGRKVADAANTFVGKGALVVRGESFRYDCSGLVEAALAKAGLSLDGSSLMLFDEAHARGVFHRRHLPKPGDVAFWDNTYDRDKNGRLDDAVTHSGIVVGVDAAGTIDLVHLGSQGVAHIHMNLKHPHDRLDAHGEVQNDYLRAKSGHDPFGTEYLAGELWVGFAAFYGG